MLLVSAMLLSPAAAFAPPARGSSRSAPGAIESFALAAGRPQKKRVKLSAGKIREAEQRLSDLGYWTGPIDRVLDAGSRQALVAFQKVEGRTRTGRLTLNELEALRSATRPPPLEGGPFHVEVDLMRQVLFIVDTGGTVSRILPVSTGNDQEFDTLEATLTAVTPRGRFKILRRVSGWRKSELGLMYYPGYIVGGIAIHGSKSVPAYPASHGCIRIPMHAAKEFSDIAPIGTPVIVHENRAVPNDPGTL
jgi:lipoprotein-anchoring transpeptidase ErfK/SrfK